MKRITNILTKLTYAVLTISLTMIATSLAGCTHDDPEGEHNNHRPGIAAPADPSNPNGNGSENSSENGEQPSSGENNPEEETSPVVGIWIGGTNGMERLTFTKEGRFEESLQNAAGEWETTRKGDYTYNDTTRWLWLSIEGDEGVYMKEYRCRIDNDTMTLTETTGRKKTYNRIQ